MSASPVRSGHRMSLRVEPPGAKPARTGRGYRIAGVIIALFVLIAMPKLAVDNVLDEGGGVGEMIWYIALGWVCGLPLFAGVPWMVGYTMRRQAHQDMYLNGTELTIMGAIREAPNTFDLTRARAEVRLVGGLRDNNATRRLAQGKSVQLWDRDHQIGRGPLSGAARHGVESYEVPFHPVLVLYRDSDDMAFAVELCQVSGRLLRDPRETALLEQVMRLSHDPGIQHAAGQLRTVMAWRALPHITDADPMAIPAAPPDQPTGAPPIPTPVRTGQPSPEITVTGPIQ